MYRIINVFHFLLLISFVKSHGKYTEEKNLYADKFDEEKPFRMQKINLVWQKAKISKKIVAHAELPGLYRELVVQDKLELDYKKKSAEDRDPLGEEEASIRKRLHAIMIQYGLMKDDVNDRREDNDVLTFKARDAELFDQKLAKLWVKAQQSGFDDNELEDLKTEFEHHQQKINELDLLKTEVDTLEDISDNSIDRFGRDGKDLIKEKEGKHKELKQKYQHLKTDYMNLEAKISKDEPIPGTPFKNPKVIALWNQAKKANFTDTELLSFQEELYHFEKKLLKHEYKQREAEMAALHLNHIPDKSNFAPKVDHETDNMMSESQRKLKKYHTTLKKKIADRLHTEL